MPASEKQPQILRLVRRAGLAQDDMWFHSLRMKRLIKEAERK
jgi:hypothetical protein